ncbi:disease resistance protein RGA2-like isoform X2 [Quercus robur]|uniref:disease resistance protein RGA2-like isoform X2 n=1 Tax=Quercus robur TaxID=38942 RepID=UPI002161D018|nr:disease resistance protein RGA2-like isoform X2 [Quercus robur]
MADAILYGVVQKIIESSGSSTLKQIGSIWGVKDDLEKMNNTVLAIQAVLQDAEEQQVQNKQVEHWLNRLRDVVFDADDLLSEFSTHVLQRKVMGGDKMAKKVRIFFSRSNQLVFSFKMACKIKATREKLNDIATDWKNFHLELVERPLKTQDVTRDRDQTHSYIGEEEVIGREKERKDIVDLLLDFDVKDNVSFVCIVGIGGLGKTTLAQYVYNDKSVKDYFDLKMWVCVSDDFDVKKITEKIIESATKTKPENLGMDPLQNKLRDQLNQKKYLLVLDDVWNENKDRWCNLKRLLMGGAKGSKVLITTRTKLVAEITSTIKPYVLSGLPKDKSWSLLKRMAFGEGQDTTDPGLETIGMDIVEKCQGVPLAVKTIGRVLYFKTTETEWLDIENNELTNVNNGILPVLKLSYDHLPSYLKCCFAYCSLFPKDYLIDKLTLIQLWIAQGFIQSQEKNKQLEDIANQYFMDLHWRSFFQEAEEDEGMNMKFKMHDLIHDLAQSVSKSEFTLVDSNVNNVNEKVRHLSFSIDNVSFIRQNLSTLVKANKMRAFILACDPRVDEGEIVEDSILKPLISSFKYLRVLDLHGLEMKTLPNTIGKLMHLKYLDLSYNEIEVLPSSITRLVNLQTLKLSCCTNLKELPADIQKLVSLKHLNLKGCKNLTHMPRELGQLTCLQALNLSGCVMLRELPADIQKLVSLKHLHIDGCKNLTHMPCGLGQMTSLQTLTLFVVSKGSVGSFKHCGGLAGLKKLNDLRGKLEIKNLGWVKDASSEFKAANLKEKQHLSELELSWNLESDDAVDTCDDENSMDGLQPHQSLKSLQMDGYMGVRFSSWLSFLTNLVELRIYNCKKCQYLPTLYQLSNLRLLSIQDMDGLEYMTDGDMNDEISASLASPSTFFPSLQTLGLSVCFDLKGWWRSVDKGNEATTTSTISSTNHYHQHMPYFPRLSSLWLDNCPKMTCMPLFPNLEIDLWLRNSSLKALEETIEMNNRGGRASSFPSSSSSSSSSFSPPLSKLKQLTLTLELESLPEEWFKNLTSLERLNIWWCPNLTSLPEGMSHLTSLQSLHIRCCPQLKQRCEKENGEDWDKISHIPNLRIVD